MKGVPKMHFSRKTLEKAIRKVCAVAAKSSWLVRISMLLMVLVIVAVSACNLGPETASGSTNAAQASRVTPMPAVAHRGRLTIQMDPDITGSYPRSLLHQFLQQMAGWIAALPQVNSEPATLYITYLNHAPYLPASSPLSFTLAGVPDWPQVQTTPVPSCPNQPYACIPAQETVTAHNSAATVTYQQQLQEVKGQLQAAQQKAQQYSQQVQALNPAIDDKATSVYGVLNLASERFSGVTGDKWLILASDLGNNTAIDEIAPDLTGVHVLVLDLYCTSAVSCSQMKTTWKAVFTRAHVASVAFLEPAESQTMQSPWSSQ